MLEFHHCYTCICLARNDFFINNATAGNLEIMINNSSNMHVDLFQHSQKCQWITLFDLFGPPAVTRRVYKIQSLSPSIFSSIVQVLSLNCIISFTKFWHGAINPYEDVCNRAGFSGKNVFAPKIGKTDQKRAKNSLF